jgi:protein involved in polysaccharide export with SLBB domain
MRENIVWVDGMVKHPGTFERFDGMRVSDLIDRGQLRSNNVFRDRADLFRRLPDGGEQIVAIDLKAILAGDSLHDVRLTNLDSLYVYSTDEVVPRRHVYIDGMVQNPGAYPLYSRMTVADLIFLAGNLKESAYLLEAELARIDSTGATSLIKVPLDRVENGTEFFLRENDHLFVRKTPGYELHRMVTIEGEVLFPGKYSLSRDNETLWGLFHRAGGFTEKAFPLGAVFKRRAIVDDLERKDINAILNSSLPLLSDSTGELRPQPSVEFEPRNMDRIIIDMERLIATGGSEGNFTLQSGDYIYVPEVPTGISVLGEVSANGTIKYQPDRKVKYYLEQAGGFTKRADKGEIRLVKANGRVYADNVRGRKVDLGDVVVVPAEVKKEKDWLKIVSTSLSIVTGVATSILIIDRL